MLFRSEAIGDFAGSLPVDGQRVGKDVGDDDRRRRRTRAPRSPHRDADDADRVRRNRLHRRRGRPASAPARPGAARPESPPPAEPPHRVPIEELVLANGMRFLLVHRPETTMVAAGWAARSGSADESPDATGMAHLIEHLLFKGSRTIGTRSFERERKLLREIDRVREEVLRLEGGEPTGKSSGRRSTRAARSSILTRTQERSRQPRHTDCQNIKKPSPDKGEGFLICRRRACLY